MIKYVKSKGNMIEERKEGRRERREGERKGTEEGKFLILKI